MEWQWVLLLIVGSLFVLLLSGMPIVICFLVINVIGVYLVWGGGIGLGQLFLNMKASVTMWIIVPVPMFILMGEVLFQSGMAARIIDVIDMWLGRVPGRLALLALGSGSVLASLCGTDTASVSVLASTLSPEMEKRGYKKPMSLGPIIGCGGLAVMIPPSVAVVIIATIAIVPIGESLIAAIFPGVLMAILYGAYIITRCYLQPSLAPAYRVPPMPLAKRLRVTVLNAVPVVILIFLVTGVIFMGIATPTEASASGALGAIIITAAYGRMNWKVMKTSLLFTARITIMLLSIILTALIFGQVLATTGCVKGIIAWVTTLDLPPIVLVIGMQLIFLFLGCFMDLFAIEVTVIPIFMPIALQLGFDPIWFIILLLINCEMGFTTPPFGLTLFVMKGVAPPDTKMSDIYKAGLPFLACDAIAMAIVIAFPQIALWLPSKMITH